MSSFAPRAAFTPEEFLAWEREQPERHHYMRGEVFAMAGGSARHAYLAMRAGFQLGRHLEGGPCDPYGSDLRLALAPRHFGYADAVVVCRPLEFRPGTTDTVTNPRLVIEVLSKSTEAYDRGDKQASYLALPSLEHYLLVSQREARLEVYTRQLDGSFRYVVYGAGARIELAALGTIDVDELYRGAWDINGDE